MLTEILCRGQRCLHAGGVTNRPRRRPRGQRRALIEMCKDYWKDSRTPDYTWPRIPYQRAIRSFSYSYLHVYESRRIPGIQIYLNLESVNTHLRRARRGGERGGRGQYIYLSDIV